MEKAKMLSWDEKIEKARSHKYIRRTGAPKHFIYTYKEAKKLPKGGAVAMTDTNLQATAADILGHRFGMNPSVVFEWGQKHGIDLKGLVGTVDVDELVNAVVSDKPLTGKTFKMDVEEASKVLGELESQGKKGTEEWKNAVEDWKDAQESKGKTFKMDAPFDVPVLPMNRKAKKFYIENIDRKLGIVPKGHLETAESVHPWYKKPEVPEKWGKTFKIMGIGKPKLDELEVDMQSKFDKLPRGLQYNPGQKLPKGTEDYGKLKDWKDAKVRYDRAKEGKDFRAGKTLKMEGEAPRHVILEGGPNRRLKPQDKAARIRDELTTSAPAYLKPAVKKNINGMLHDKTAYDGTPIVGYHEEIPLSDIFNVLKDHGIVPLQEDQTEWSGLLIGREGQVYFDLAPFGSRSPEKEFEHTFKPFKNVHLALSWYTMESGKYEIGAYLA